MGTGFTWPKYRIEIQVQLRCRMEYARDKINSAISMLFVLTRQRFFAVSYSFFFIANMLSEPLNLILHGRWTELFARVCVCSHTAQRLQRLSSQIVLSFFLWITPSGMALCQLFYLAGGVFPVIFRDLFHALRNLWMIHWTVPNSNRMLAIYLYNWYSESNLKTKCEVFHALTKTAT